MAKCDYCGTTILFGGMKQENLRFCNNDCYQKGNLLIFSREISQDVIDEQAQKIYHGLCPKCNGSGPVDVHTSHRVYSAFVLTSWKSVQNVCCRSCGKKSQIKDALFSLALGWWGFPWGFIVTPVQIIRNISEMSKASDGLKPSDKLMNLIRINIASQIVQNRAQEAQNKGASDVVG